MSNLSQSVSTLQSLLSNLKPNDAKFAADLIASYNKYGSLTPKQAPWIEKLIVRANVTIAQGLYPALATAPLAAAEVTEPVNVGGFEGVVSLFTAAQAHLKFPKITLKLDDATLKLSLNGAKSKTPGSVAVVKLYGPKSMYKLYLGRVTPEGQFVPSYSLDADQKDALVTLLTEFAKNPARVAKEHGKLTGNCCFCNKPIGEGEDKRSVLVGFGPVCADHYGLKAEWLSGVAKAEAKASLAAPTMSDGIAPEVITAINEQTAADEQIASFLVVKTVEPTEHEEVFGQVLNDTVPNGAQTICFFCEKPGFLMKELNGYNVCSSCVKQLV